MVRHNIDGSLQTDVYENVSALALDPLEKKPLYHFYPGRQILSIGSFGCNMSCSFCQNFEISQPSAAIMNSRRNTVGSAEILHQARQIKSNIGLAFTYNEPVVWFEFMLEMAESAGREGLSTVMISNGFVNREPMKDLLEHIDAFNIDLKAFNNDFYRKYTGSSLKPVLNTLTDINSAGKHLEITFLVIPGYNDDTDEFRECIAWINDKLGPDTPLHLSRYFPNYNFSAPPTPEATLRELFSLAKEKLNFVYPGNINIEGIMDTVCPDCGAVITSRSAYRIKHLNTQDGSCSECGRLIYKYFSR
jgi:pyruvate formate lyase activating enzyme